MGHKYKWWGEISLPHKSIEFAYLSVPKRPNLYIEEKLKDDGMYELGSHHWEPLTIYADMSSETQAELKTYSENKTNPPLMVTIILENGASELLETWTLSEARLTKIHEVAQNKGVMVFEFNSVSLNSGTVYKDDMSEVTDRLHRLLVATEVAKDPDGYRADAFNLLNDAHLSEMNKAMLRGMVHNYIAECLKQAATGELTNG